MDEEFNHGEDTDSGISENVNGAGSENQAEASAEETGSEKIKTEAAEAEEKKEETPVDEGEAWFRSIYDPNGTEDEGQAGKKPKEPVHREETGSASGQETNRSFGDSCTGQNESQGTSSDHASGGDSYKSYNSYEFKESNEQEKETNDYVNYHDPEGSGGHPRRPDHHKNHNQKNTTAIVIGVVAALCVAVVLLIAAAFTTYQKNSPTSKSATTEAADSAAESRDQVTLGNKDTDSESKDTTSTSEADSDVAAAEEATTGTDLSIPQVVKKVMPSMVQITNTTVEQVQDLFGQTQQQTSVSAGSGIIVGETDDNLLIATNNHVVSGSSDIAVTFVDNSAIAGTVQGTDADNDLAIVSVKKTDIPESTQNEISIVTIGDSDSTEVGEGVVAIGNALGYGQSVSSGIISALNRKVTDSDGTERTVIQTDASINPGNSGGALLNMKGELIGINEAKLVDESVEGVGYAIPMSVAEPILTKLGNKATREKVDSSRASYLGVSVMTVPTQYTQSGYPAGVYVASVTQNGPADQAGIQEGDIITSFDGTSVTSQEDLLNLLEYYAAGEKAEVSLSRVNSDRSGYEKKKVIVTLGSRADANLSSSTSSSDTTNNSQGNVDPFNDNSGNGFFDDFFN
ncbi:MAG: trypsin-like peptidase domain-containing protein [Lachnospiraceae bacterium]|nr:trypsin-like peptidase domain-containing protein [Lachnospiraceae bacterium]